MVPEPDKRGKHLRPVGKNDVLQSLGSHSYTVHTITTTSASSSTAKVKKEPKNSRKKPRSSDIKQTMFAPPPPPMVQLPMHPHCTPPPPAHTAPMQEPPHAYIPNGELYFPSHYLEPHQPMMPPHMNQMTCQKMLDAPAYFMAGMKENTFHQ